MNDEFKIALEAAVDVALKRQSRNLIRATFGPNDEIDFEDMKDSGELAAMSKAERLTHPNRYVRASAKEMK